MALSINAHNVLSGLNSWETLSGTPCTALETLENLVVHQSQQQKLEEAEKIHVAIATGCKILKHLKLLSHEQREKVSLLQALSKQQKKAIRFQEQHISPKLIRPAICTAEVKTITSQKKLKKIAHRWQMTARAQRTCALHMCKHALTHSSLQTLKDCEWVAHEIGFFLPKKPTSTSDHIYVAYLTNKVVLGIMLTSQSPKKRSIDFIVSNPKAQNLLEIEKSTLRGAATALIRHYAHDLFKNKSIKTKTLSLTPLDSAVPIYEHLGFTGSRANMVLTKRKMEILVRNNSGNHLLQTEAPEDLRY